MNGVTNTISIINFTAGKFDYNIRVYLRFSLDSYKPYVLANAEKTGKKMILSTVYRNLKNMEDVGILKKTFNEDGSYMYILKGENSCKAEIECEKCHKTVEIQEDTLKEAEKTLEKLGFSLSENIHLKGECKNCKES